MDRMQRHKKAMASMRAAFAARHEVLTPTQCEVFVRSFGPMYRRG
jgi:hypothetical protein